jgi:hypothetical protein
MRSSFFASEEVIELIIIIIIICLLFREDEMRKFCSTCGREEKSNRVWRKDLKRPPASRDHR